MSEEKLCELAPVSEESNALLQGSDSDFEVLSISIASDEVIRNEWSRGEIKKPETINYRTFKPEKGGLFCEKIFGPTKDCECACGKYKKTKNKGVVCDRCGVEVTLSKVRRERMAHIELAIPVVHIWFFKTMPSRIGNLLGLSLRDLERIVYYEEHVVVDPGNTDLQRKQLLTDQQLKESKERWGSAAFSASMGGVAIRELLASEDLEASVSDLKDKLRKTRSAQARMKLAKRLKIIEAFLASGNRPEDMVLSALPVIPPQLRPLVALDGGRFATSDLNDLYRRVINRNNRLKAILKLKTPEVIVRNEKRMLQEAVDALFDNGRHGHPVMGAGNRQLKGLAEVIKGKKGRVRENLLGKRVDYSARSVVVSGPGLSISQCGIPKEMALVLFDPFIVRRLRELGHAYTVPAAKKMIRRRDPVVWDVLEETIKGHVVLLNRAPTLHRLGIQAFEPVLIEGKAIRLHPLVCSAFNADFDGDQMAVHLPLSIEAQLEARLLMMAPDNIFLPSSGKPVAVPSQDMILGIYYLMHDPIYDPEAEGKPLRVFASTEEVLTAMSYSKNGMVERERVSGKKCWVDWGRGFHLHERVKVRLKDGNLVETTPGRVLFNTIVPPDLGFQNSALPTKKVGELILQCYNRCGLETTVRFLDNLKSIGFAEATKAAPSVGITDIVVPENKGALIAEAQSRVAVVQKQYEDGVITEGERYSKIISIWTEVSDMLSNELQELVSKVEEGRINPLHMFTDSGARGNRSQLKQLGAMRGLMVKPSREIIETPIMSNFREGLTVIEYFISSHGGRKGLADTALKTADSGYLTRRLVDVAHDIIITEYDCDTFLGIEVSGIKQGHEELIPLSERIVGRTVCEDVYQPGDAGILLASAGSLLTKEQAERIDDAGIETVRVRSSLTCEAKRGVCAKCYGVDLANGKIVALGEAVGIIAAQSIGEPGTQLTMRTFHLGGIASTLSSPELVSNFEGILVYMDLRVVRDQEGRCIVLNKNGSVHVMQDENRPLEEYKKLLANNSIQSLQSFPIDLGSQILFEDGATVSAGDCLAQWEQHNIPIICDKPGYVKYEDLVEGISTQKDLNKQTGQSELVVKQHRGELHPQIAIYEDSAFQNLKGFYSIPAGAVLSVQEGQYVETGQVLARLPRGTIRTKDITGGLPRVAELVEARKPKDAAEIAKIDGVASVRGVQKNRRVVIIRDEVTGMEEEHFIPMTKHLLVQSNDHVLKGQSLCDGLVVPHEILDICGVRELQKYLVNQIQEVYALQGVSINDKHVEIIVRRMLEKLRVTDPGNTTLLYGEEVDRKEFYRENSRTIASGGKPAQATPILQGITKASLSTESFVSAASFQDTTRILTEAACAGKCDYRLGFKENVIMGKRVPGGTGFWHHALVTEVIEKSSSLDLNFDFESVFPEGYVPMQVAPLPFSCPED
ncbi:DNA-directed RNA polymerase subunit beta' [Candidatus Similichlamydia laticola]|uniref:DNA-directed RNA polymerase subunit beta' n=1 Tax=Candidatus Similichlamydia laticola TaxID=2170265 RepID=A0A369KL19_9BACT|nr:DNA-directed RNA polymerase subunit beta' [Candidatus Similichlamydia laticola]RDB31706.1 DNA-directed RNA polymerase beta' subunit [Candidatus Similichlamydia laticola]